jgi:hypothetical protein
MSKRIGGNQQHFKNAAQLHQQKLDRYYKQRAMRIMEQDFLREEARRKHESVLDEREAGAENETTTEA